MDFLFLQVYQIIVTSTNNTALDPSQCQNLLFVYNEFFKEGDLSEEVINGINNQLNGGKAKVAVFCGLPKTTKVEDVTTPPQSVVFDVTTRTIDPDTLTGSTVHFENKNGETLTCDPKWHIEYNKGTGHTESDSNLWCCIGTFNTETGALVENGWEEPFVIDDNKIETSRTRYSYNTMNLDFKLMFSSYLAYRVQTQTWQ